MIEVLALLLTLLAAPGIFAVSPFIVDACFEAAERFGRFRGTICL